MTTATILNAHGLIFARPERAGANYQYRYDILCAKTGVVVRPCVNAFECNHWLLETGRARRVNGELTVAVPS